MQITDKIILKEKINEVINYFDIFKYPLTLEEIYRFITIKTNKDDLKKTLDVLNEDKDLLYEDGFYSKANINARIQKRYELNHLAEFFLNKSIFYSSLLSYFPFVRSLAITGSLSKKCAQQNSDIDFFVIVEPNRLWICKNMIQLFKNFLRLFGKEEYMCANYFKALDEKELEEKSKFTEMELITMLPVYGEKEFKKFYETNNWAYSKYPNLNFKIQNSFHSKQSFIIAFLKNIIESFINIFGDFLDDFLMKTIKKRWEKAHLSNFESYEEFDKSIKIRKNEIKYHLNNSRIKLKEKKSSLI